MPGGKIPAPRSRPARYVARMTASRSRLLLTLAVTIGAVVLGTAVAPALTTRATPKRITAAGVGSVKLGATYLQLRAKGLVGKIGPGCVVASPRARAALLRPPLSGSVDLTLTSPRRAAVITVRGGATARGVGIGATIARVKRAFPTAITDRRFQRQYRITLLKVPKRGGGRFDFVVDTQTKKVALIAIPRLTFCE
jgi:hypothetical protein